MRRLLAVLVALLLVTPALAVDPIIDDPPPPKPTQTPEEEEDEDPPPKPKRKRTAPETPGSRPTVPASVDQSRQKTLVEFRRELALSGDAAARIQALFDRIPAMTPTYQQATGAYFAATQTLFQGRPSAPKEIADNINAIAEREAACSRPQGHPHPVAE